MAQQTAVEWLIDQVEDFIGLIPVDIIEQAKQMEKEQIEISDEDIENFAEDKTTTLELYQGFLSGAKWYREQLKKK